MKRKMTALMVGFCAVALLVGCGNSEISNDKIKIEQYKKLEVEQIEELKVTDADIENTIQSNLDTLELDVEGRAAQLGDVVYIDFEGKKDGVPFEGGTAPNQRLVLGEAGYTEGFEDGIVGHKAGETFDLDITFPADYGVEELNGQAVVFTITLHEVKACYEGELTEEILPYLSTTAKTIEAYKEEIKDEMEKSNAISARDSLISAAWEALLEKCVVLNYPAEEVEKEKENVKNSYSFYAMLYGLEIDEFIEQAGINLEKEAKSIICKSYATELIEEKENLTVTDKLYKEKLEELANIQGATDLEQLEKEYGKENLEKQIIEELVGDFLADNCVQVEPKAEKKVED